ncbi:MAG: hypothetical protein CSA35_05045 [Dethiosulfovibrio peptidovorans]|nr:MAG: hypothetical protein CSA35_05045 [Dethiosulfovibrio peptidovorans]
MTRKRLNALCGAAGLVLAAAMFLQTRTIPDRAPSARGYVLFLVAVLGCLCLLLLIQSGRSGDNRTVSWFLRPWFFWSTVGAVALYVFVLSWLGFFLASALFMAVLGWTLGFRKPLWLLACIGGLLGFVYLVFVRFLSVPVPPGSWGA